MKKYATVRYCCSGHSLLIHEQLSSFWIFTFHHADQLTGSSQLLFTICRHYLGFVWLKAAVWCGWKCERLQSALLNQIIGITIETAIIPLCNVLWLVFTINRRQTETVRVFFYNYFYPFLKCSVCSLLKWLLHTSLLVNTVSSQSAKVCLISFFALGYYRNFIFTPEMALIRLVL